MLHHRRFWVVACIVAAGALGLASSSYASITIHSPTWGSEYTSPPVRQYATFSPSYSTAALEIYRLEQSGWVLKHWSNWYGGSSIDYNYYPPGGISYWTRFTRVSPQWAEANVEWRYVP